MFSRFLTRVFRKHFFFHLLLPLLVGVLVEVVFSPAARQHWDDPGAVLRAVLNELLSAGKLVGFAAIIVTYFVVVGFLIRNETDIMPDQLEFPDLVESLRDAESIFAIGTLEFDEWFDPAVQVYLATLYSRRIENPTLKYERILLLSEHAAERALAIDFLDGYAKKCLVRIHQCLKIDLYKVFAPDIRQILSRLDQDTKIGIGFLPLWLCKLPQPVQTIITKLTWHRRVRRVAALVIIKTSGNSAVVFSKRNRIVRVTEPPQSAPYTRFIQEIRKQICRTDTDVVRGRYKLQ